MGNEGAQCLAPNGKLLFFTACDRDDGLGRYDIYISIKRNDTWSEARNRTFTTANTGNHSLPCHLMVESFIL